MRPGKTYTGPALFSYGFRPLFLLAGCFAAVIVPLWMAVWSGRAMPDGPFSPMDWHIHEMLFGYPSAVVAGVLVHRHSELDRTDADAGLALRRPWPLVASRWQR